MAPRRPGALLQVPTRGCCRRSVSSARSPRPGRSPCVAIDGKAIAGRVPGDGREPDAVLVQDDLGVRRRIGEVDVAGPDEKAGSPVRRGRARGGCLEPPRAGPRAARQYRERPRRGGRRGGAGSRPGGDPARNVVASTRSRPRSPRRGSPRRPVRPVVRTGLDQVVGQAVPVRFIVVLPRAHARASAAR